MSDTVIVDDAELLRMAERPAEPLLPVLDHSAAMWPLIVVFALFPVTFATYYRTFDDSAARWGHRAVDALAAETTGEFLFPGSGAERFAAPLSSWLEAGVLASTWPGWPVSIVAVSALAVVATCFAVYFALMRLAGSRFALWTTLLVCCHPVILAAGTTPAPRALGGCLQLAALGCLLRHRISLGRVVGGWNIATGVLLGLTLLASGPAFIVGVVTASVYVVLRSIFGRDDRETPTQRGTLRSIGALAVVIGTAMLVGGWWLIAAVAQHGSAAVTGWLALQAGPNAPRSLEFGPGDVLRRLVPLTGVLVGFVVVGFWRCLSHVKDERDEPRRVASMLLAAFGSSVISWMIVSTLLPSAESIREWGFPAVVPILALGVVGIESVRERAIGVLGTALLAIGSLLVWIVWQFGGPLWSSISRKRIPLVELESVNGDVLLFVAIVGGIAMIYGAWRASRADDEWRRAYATATIVGLVVLQVAIGFVVSRRTSGDDRALQQFQTQLAVHESADQVVLVGAAPASPRIEYLLHRLWPRTPISPAQTRDEAIALILKRVEVGGSAVLVNADPVADRPIDPTGERFQVTVVSPRRLFREHRLRAHVLVRLAEDAESNVSPRP